MDEQDIFKASLDALQNVKAKQAARDAAQEAYTYAQTAYVDAVGELQAYRDQLNDLFGMATGDPRVRMG